MHSPQYSYIAFDIDTRELQSPEPAAKIPQSELLTLRLQMDVRLTDMRMISVRQGYDRGHMVPVGDKLFRADVDTQCTVTDDATWAHSARQSAVLQADAQSLRLFHVLDLVRLVDELIQNRQMDPLHPELLPILFAAALKPFTSTWDSLVPAIVEKHEWLLNENAPVLQSLTDVFYRRWTSNMSGSVFTTSYSLPGRDGHESRPDLRQRPSVSSLVTRVAL